MTRFLHICISDDKLEKAIDEYIVFFNTLRPHASLKYYTPEELIGKKIILVSNLNPVNLRGVKSEGMILAASHKKDLALAVIDKDIEEGTVVS